jgi:hypothetical protein
VKNKSHSAEDTYHAQKYLRRVDDTYIFDAASGLYQPRSQKTEHEVEKDNLQEINHGPVVIGFEVEKDWISHLIAFSALLVSIFTLFFLCLTVYYTQKQWKAANAMVKIARNGNIIAQSANAQTLIKAQQSNDISRDSLITVQRAFVFPTAYLTELVTNGKPNGLEVTVSWQNSGSTPTKNLVLHANDYTGTTGIPDDVDAWEKVNRGYPRDSATFLGPKQVLPAWNEHLKDFQVKVWGPASGYKFWGTATYNDVFPLTRQHITRYCYKVVPRESVVNGPGGSGTIYDLDQCQNYNCIDDECKAQTAKTVTQR